MDKSSLIMIAAYTVSIPASVGFFKFTKLPKEFKYLALLSCASLLFEVASTLCKIYFGNNLYVIQAYTAVESHFLLLFLSAIILNKLAKKIAFYSIFLIDAVVIFEMSFYPFNYGTYAVTIESIIVIGFVCIYFVQIAEGMNTLDVNFFAAGVIAFYFLSSLVYFALNHYLDSDSLIFLTDVHSVVNAIRNIVSGIIIWKAASTKSLLLS